MWYKIHCHGYAGIVLYYCMLQLNIWWVFHVCVLFWKVRFPFHSLKNAHRMFKIHLTLVVLGIIIPLLPVIATIAHSQTPGFYTRNDFPEGLGFGLAQFPPILCYTLDKDIVFYSFILPVTFLMFVGITVLLITIWIVHKVKARIIDSWFCTYTSLKFDM